MVLQPESLGNYVLSLLDNGQGRETIENLLLEKGHDERFVKELVTETIKLRQTKRRAQGLTFILVGAVICLLSCILTITSSFSTESFPYVLYGFTSLGIVVVFFGLMRVF